MSDADYTAFERKLDAACALAQTSHAGKALNASLAELKQAFAQLKHDHQLMQTLFACDVARVTSPQPQT
jgi:hypothetical protein